MKKAVRVLAVVMAFGAGAACIATKQSYLEKGNKYYDAGKYEEARLNYLKAIQKDPKFGEAQYRLGLAALKADPELRPDLYRTQDEIQKARTAHVREAYDSLFRALQLQPDRVEVKEKFADLCLSLYLSDQTRPHRFYQQIQDLSKELLEQNPNSYEGLMLQGYMAQTDRKPKEAIVNFRKALKINSSDAGVVMALAQALLLDQQPKESEQILLDLVNRQKTSYGPAYDFLYSVYLNAGRTVDAENVLKAKVANNPKQADWIVQLAQYYNRAQKPAETKATLDRLLNNPQDFPKARMAVGDFYMSTRNYPEAIHYYEEGARSLPKGKDRTLYQDNALFALLAEGKKDEAARLADQILRENPQDDTAARLQADIWLDSGKPENLDPALRTFQRLSKQSPNDATLRLHLGRAYRKKGDLESARREFQESVRLNKGLVEARQELGVALLLRGQSREALQQAKEILALRPDYRPGKLLRTESLIRSGDLKTARAELAALAKDSSGQDSQVQFQMALIAYTERRFPEAINTLNALRSTGDARVFVGLSNIYVSQRDFDRAYGVLSEGLKKSSDVSVIHNQMAVIAIFEKQYDRAISELQKVLDTDPKAFQTMRLMADVYEKKKDPAEAIKMYRKAYETAPNDVPSALALAIALARAGKTDEARRQYLSIVKAQPDDPVVLNNTAYALADSGGDLDEALRYARTAIDKAPNVQGFKDTFTDTLGYVYLKKGLKDSAFETFTGLVHKNPHVATYRYHLGLALLEQGDKVKARKELQTALTDHPSPQDEDKIKELLKKLG